MSRPIALLGAPSNIGIKPYGSGRPRGLDRAPAVLRSLGVVTRLGATDVGDVTPHPYRDLTHIPGRVRNESEVVQYTLTLADRIGPLLSGGHFTLVLGGDCSIVLGSLLGAASVHTQRSSSGRQPAVALAYIDGHADFATPTESRTGSAASMCLGLAVGRGNTPLARLAGDVPLVHPGDIALIGRRDEAEPWYGHVALHASAVLDLPYAAVRDAGIEQTAATALGRVAREDLSGFWIHVDADVIDPTVMPAVDSPEPGGPSLEELAALLRPLARHPKSLGMELTIYDPQLDPDHACGRRLVALLDDVLGAGAA